MNTINGYTRSELAKLTNCPYYIIDYLRNSGRLKYIRKPKGKGTTAIYHQDSIKIIIEHVNSQLEGARNENL